MHQKSCRPVAYNAIAKAWRRHCDKMAQAMQQGEMDMSRTTFETVLHEAQQLAPDEQARLLAALGQQTAVVADSVRVVRDKVARAQPITDDERERVVAWLAELDALAAEIGAASHGTTSAVDAVREQRRDL